MGVWRGSGRGGENGGGDNGKRGFLMMMMMEEGKISGWWGRTVRSGGIWREREGGRLVF